MKFEFMEPFISVIGGKQTIMLFLDRSSIVVLVALIFFTLIPRARAAEPADGIRQISMGEHHACAVTFGGALLCWGDNRHGQIGDGTVGDKNRYPTQADKRHPTQVFARGVTAVSAGYSHTCAVVNNGLQCWGWNQTGQVNGTPGADVLKPLQVIDKDVITVSAGSMHTCAQVRDAAFCWGSNGYGEIGNGAAGDSVKPVQVIASGLTAISAGGQRTCAIVRSALQCWGNNQLGQIGNGRAGDNALRPTEIIASGVTSVSLGNDNTACAVAHGAALCWGKKSDVASNPNRSSWGSCSALSKIDRNLDRAQWDAAKADCDRVNKGTMVLRPAKIIPNGVSAVSVSGTSGCAVVHGGLQCWGYNHMGSTGVSDSSSITPDPTQVIASGVTAVAMGADATCVVVNGALRCRGYNGYGAISSTIGLEPIADSSLFSSSKGDARTISHAAADAVAVLEKLPEMVALHLQGKLITHNNAVYFVRAARGSYIGQTAGERMAFDLDVMPLYPTTSAPAGGASRKAMISADTQCGDPALPRHLTTASIGLRKGDGFVDLRSALKNEFPQLPPFADGDENFQLHFGDADLQKIATCAKAFDEAAQNSPMKAIMLGAGDIPLTLDSMWRIPGEGVHGADLMFTVEVKPGRKADFFVEAQSVSVMRCGELVLNRWIHGVSSPWKLHGLIEGTIGYFDLDEDIIRAIDLPIFPAYTQAELRRAIYLERGRDGLASLEEAKACAPTIEGYKYTIRNPSNIVREVYNPGFGVIPVRSCQQPLPTLALRVADKLGRLRGQKIHTAICKAWPGKVDSSIVALVRPQAGATDDQANYHLDLAVVKTGSGEILQHLAQQDAISSDAMRFDGISLDTANYALASGVRAFGVRTMHSHIGGTSSSDETLSLYVPDGKTLKPVLLDMTMNLLVSDRGGECNEARGTARTLAVGGPGKRGWADLVVKEKSSDQQVKMIGNGCVESMSRSSRQYLLQFDGIRYVAPKEMQ
jgi:hypothetical protein